MIRVEPYTVEDAPLLYAAARESIEAMRPWMPWCHANYAMTDAEAWTARQAANFVAGTEYDFVMKSETEAFLGACGLNTIDKENRRANLGYWVRASARGRGVATAATKLLVEWVFANTDLNRLEVVIALGNTASLRVAEKAGAFREGTARQRIFLEGVAHDAAVFSFVR